MNGCKCNVKGTVSYLFCLILTVFLQSWFCLTANAAGSANAKTSNSSISSNPAAINISTGSGVVQRFVEKKLGIKNDHGISVGGAWVGDINQLFSGGIPHPDRTTNNSLLILSLTVDTEKFNGWKGGLFGAQVLQLNAQKTNIAAGSVQGYNSIPGPPPLNRFELYQLWYRQAFFDEKFLLRIGKTVPTYDFGNVLKPVALSKDSPNIPAVSGLIFTPIFINASLLDVMPGYYNSAYGITMSFAPIKEWYLSYGIYDGNQARNEQIGLHATPTWNGAHFQIAETGVAWLLGTNKLPGNIGTGIWRQHGTIKGPPNITENNAFGFYLFGSQRLWYKNPGIDTSGISVFYQYGVNNSRAMPMRKYVGAGLTAFGLIAKRLGDSIGAGAAFSWLNPNSFNQSNELILQAYYQAQIIPNIYLEPVVSYIPSPGTNGSRNNAWAGTLRAIIVF